MRTASVHVKIVEGFRKLPLGVYILLLLIRLKIITGGSVERWF